MTVTNTDLTALRADADEADRSGQLTDTAVAVVAVTSHQLAAAAAEEGSVDVAAANLTLAQVAAADVSAASLLWRQVTNLERAWACGGPAASRIVEQIAHGRYIASAFDGTASRAVRDGSGWLISTGDMMCTGAGYATAVVVTATTGDTTTAFVVPADRVEIRHRPTFVGLRAADTALVRVNTYLDDGYVLGGIGQGRHVVAVPYAAGLTLGAVAAGAASAAVDLLVSPERVAAKPDRVAEVLALEASATAIVEATPRRAPAAALWSRAAKIHAVDAALAICDLVRTIIGAPAYAAGHPLNRLERDLRALPLMAPTRTNAVSALVRSLQNGERLLNQKTDDNHRRKM